MAEESFSTISDILKSLDYNLKENTIVCNKIPSLEYMCLARIAIMIWQQSMRIEIEHVLSSVQPLEHVLFSSQLLEQIELKNKFYDLRHKAVAIASRLNLPVNVNKDLDLMIQLVERELLAYFKPEEIYCIQDNKPTWKVFLDNLCWSQVGTINYLKTAERIINSDDPSITTEFKYIVACNNCLEHKVRELYELLPSDLLDNLIKNEDNSEDKVSLVLFWTFYVKGRTVNLSFLNIKFMLQTAIKKRLYVAVQYIWENFVDNSMKEKLVDFAITYYSSPKILLYLCKQMTQTQLDEVKWYFKLFILEEIYNLSKWCDAISVSDYVLQLIKKENVFNALEIVAFSNIQNVVNLKQYLFIWKRFSLLFKPDIEKNFNFFLIENHCLLFKKNWPTTNLLLQMGSAKDRKDVLHNIDVIRKCVVLIEYRELDHLKMLISQILVTEEEISQFKKRFFSVNYVEMCTDLILSDSYEFLDKVLIEFCIEQEICRFKYKFLYNERADIIRKILCRGKVTFVDQFLIWCFDGNHNHVTKFKSVVYNFQSDSDNKHKQEVFRPMEILIEYDHWEIVENIWKWMFYVNEQVSLPIQKLKFIKRILYQMSPKSCNELLYRFITSCLRENDRNELKEAIKGSEEMQVTIGELLQHEKYTAIDELFDWCQASKEEIAGCKSNVMNSIGPDILLKLGRHKNTTTKVETLFAWFNPSVKAAKLFKQCCVHHKLLNERRSKKTLKWAIKNMEKHLELLKPYIAQRRTLAHELNNQLSQGSKGENISISQNKKMKLK